MTWRHVGAKSFFEPMLTKTSDIIIDPRNGLAPIWRQAISWIHADKDLRYQLCSKK